MTILVAQANTQQTAGAKGARPRGDSKMRITITIVAASMGLAACLPAYVAEQMPDTDGERDIFSPAVSAEPRVAAKARMMDCKQFARGGAQESEDAFARCTLVNERTQAQADLKAARSEIARLKATAAKPRPPVAPPMFQGMDSALSMAPVPSYGASTQCPSDRTGVMRMFGLGRGNGRICVFRSGTPVSVEVSGRFLPTLADIDGDGRTDGIYDCAPPEAAEICIFGVNPDEKVTFIIVTPTSRYPAKFRGMVYPGGTFRRARVCEAEGRLSPSEMARPIGLTFCSS